MKTLGWIIVLLAGAAAAAFALYQLAIGWRPPESQYPTQGATISAEQGEVHWPTLRAAGADFAYIAATDGDEGRDPRFLDHLAAARAAGIRYGVVHSWQLCRLAADQAANFLATVPRDAAALPPAVALSFEGNCRDRPDGDLLISELSVFLEAIEAYAGKPAVLYVTADFDAAYAITDRAARSFWLRRRLFKPDYGAVPWAIWEASDIRRVEGVENPVRWSVVRPPDSAMETP